jgi:hypothetical protein
LVATNDDGAYSLIAQGYEFIVLEVDGATVLIYYDSKVGFPQKVKEVLDTVQWY